MVTNTALASPSLSLVTPALLRSRPPRLSQAKAKTNKILVVEDDVDTLLGLRVLLRAHYYPSVVAQNAADALSQTLEHHPELILLDLGLPGTDGFQLLEHLGRDFVSKVPVIVLSGRDRRKNKERALLAGAVHYMQKPWDDDDLLETIDRYLTRLPYAA
jgi:two-component system, OmpR family, KDP operon response regulator KdpE